MWIEENLPEIISVVLLTSNYQSIFEAYMTISTFYLECWVVFCCCCCFLPSLSYASICLKQKDPIFSVFLSFWMLHSAVKKRKIHRPFWWCEAIYILSLISLLLKFRYSYQSESRCLEQCHWNGAIFQLLPKHFHSFLSFHHFL